MDNGTDPPSSGDNPHMRLASHKQAIAILEEERVQLVKHIDALRAERQVLEAVARKVASTRRLSGEQQS
jgi:hypothetical protein